MNPQFQTVAAMLAASVALAQDSTPRGPELPDAPAVVRALDDRVAQLGALSMRVRFDCEYFEQDPDPNPGGPAYVSRSARGTMNRSVIGAKRAIRYEVHAPEEAERPPLRYRQVTDDGVRSVIYYSTRQALIRPSNGTLSVFRTPMDFLARSSGESIRRRRRVRV